MIENLRRQISSCVLLYAWERQKIDSTACNRMAPLVRFRGRFHERPQKPISA